MKKRNLEVYFPRAQQRSLFEHLDYNRDETILLADLEDFLMHLKKDQKAATLGQAGSLSVHDEDWEGQYQSLPIPKSLFARVWDVTSHLNHHWQMHARTCSYLPNSNSC